MEQSMAFMFRELTMRKFELAAIAAVTCVLVGCGGGGGGSTSTPAPIAKAEGVYVGTLVSGGVTGAFQSVVLEDDSIWALYGVAGTGGSLLVQGFVAATGTSGNGSFSVTGKDYGYTGAVMNTTLTGTYVPGVSITGTASTGANFSGTTAAVSGYTYSTPAQIASIAGAWTGSSLFGNATSLTITSAGNYSGISGGTCAISGTLTPRPSGKNIFNVTYSNGPTGCGIPNLTAQGIGVASTLSNGKQQLIVILVTADKSTGTVAFVTK